MPGYMSLEKSEYYAHPDNVFWDIVARSLDPTHKDDTVEEFSYTRKIDLLLNNNIALWDVLQNCDRKGNLDKAIRNEIKNDFGKFFTKYPNIKTILFNGKRAEVYFRSCFKDLLKARNFDIHSLPSTSSSHSINAFRKLKQWRQALNSK